MDEPGDLPIDKTGADLLFRILSRRYLHGSTVIATDRVYRKCPEIFNNDATLTSAVLERLLHHAENRRHRGQELPHERRQDRLVIAAAQSTLQKPATSNRWFWYTFTVLPALGANARTVRAAVAQDPPDLLKRGPVAQHPGGRPMAQPMGGAPAGAFDPRPFKRSRNDTVSPFP